jgi:hypothetical protein
MYALESLSSGAGPELAWILWIVLGVLAAAIVVGWGTSLSKPKQDQVWREANPLPRTGPDKRGKPKVGKGKTGTVKKQKVRSK